MVLNTKWYSAGMLILPFCSNGKQAIRAPDMRPKPDIAEHLVKVQENKFTQPNIFPAGVPQQNYPEYNGD